MMTWTALCNMLIHVPITARLGYFTNILYFFDLFYEIRITSKCVCAFESVIFILLVFYYYSRSRCSSNVKVISHFLFLFFQLKRSERLILICIIIIIDGWWDRERVAWFHSFSSPTQKSFLNYNF